ncbi:MAG TPA: amino acid adenylation domain-containing protein [Chthoniobacter sp.]|nr:amino acid adenylation domain-containing protein [Chthoniobacter sp.]
MSDADATPNLEGIALVGLAGRFPGARNARELWKNLADGIESVAHFSDEELRDAGIPEDLTRNADYVRARATLDNADKFDAAFFGFTPRDAELTDPQQRVFLECAWHALEDAAIDPSRYKGAIGVFAGSSLNTYLLDNIASHREQLSNFVAQFQADGYPLLIGSDKDYLATRASYKLDLRGPSVTVQTACSTSLVAVVQAVNALLSYQCDAALAGGVSITFPQARGHLFQDGSILSKDGHCRAFDADATGTVFGHGCGVVVLKRLADAIADHDHIYAVIKGAALNNDGAGKVSYMAPSVDGQAEVISLAHALANVTADTIDYVEAHGTATPLGDPIEFAALTQAFRATTDKRSFCRLGTVKSNFGHLEAAAGVTGLIKTALALEHAQIPASLHFEKPNPQIDFANSPFEVVTKLTPWERRDHPRRAGVSSFGVGGTNAHVVVEEAPALPSESAPDSPQLIVLSAKTRYALEEATTQLGQYLKAHPQLPLADVAYTLQMGRRGFEHRRMLIARNTAEAAKLLLRRDSHGVFTSPLPGKPVNATPVEVSTSKLASLGWKWVHGESVDLDLLHEGSQPHRVSLPGYAFERKRFWIEPQRTPVEAPAPAVATTEPTPVATPVAAPTALTPLDDLKAFLKDQSGIELAAATPSTSLLELGFDSLFLTQIAIALQRRYGVRITLRQLLGELADLGPLSAFLEANGKTQPGTEKAASANALTSGMPSAPAQHGPFRPLQKDLGGTLNEAQETWLQDFIRRYIARTPSSKKHTQEHRSHFADPRAVAGFKQVWKEMVYPIVVDRSQGAHLRDIDGNDYVDTTQGFGLALFGHQPAFAMQAIAEQMKHGMEIGPSHPLAGEVAALLCEMTGHERATFCNTGSEAVLGAIRIARTVTGKNKIALFAGAYHGINDEALVRPLVVNGEWRTAPIAPGIIQDAVENVLVLDYGNPESLEIIRRHAGDLAAVLVEPVQSRRPDLQPREFLHQLRALTTEMGVAMVMDEVITGFRCHPGGAQAHFGVKGDIATYGKIIGGGLPIGAITGRAEYMDAFDGGGWQFGDDSYPTAGVTFFAGTFVRHPLALAAAKAVLLHLKENGVALQNDLAARMTAMIREISPSLEGTPFELPHFASAFFIRAHDFKYSGLLYALLRHRGIHIWEGRPCFIGTAHTEEDVAKIVAAFKESLQELKSAGFFIKSGGEQTDQPLQLTDAQREVWIASMLAPEASAAFNETCALHLHGKLDFSAMRRAIDEVVRRHDALRSSFRISDGAQKFAPSRQVAIPLTDLSSLPEDERRAKVDALRFAEGARQFELAHGPLIAWQMIKLAPEEHLLILTAHHIACDGWSYDIILRELAHIYSTSSHTLPPALQFAEYVRAEEMGPPSPERKAAEAYWRELYRTVPQPLDLPVTYPRIARRTWSGARHEITLPPETKRELSKFGAQHGATLFATLLAAFKTLLHRLSGATDLVVGIPAAGQNNVEGGADLVGHCANLLPLRTQIDGSKPFSQLLGDVRLSVLDAFEHQQFTFGRLLAELPIPRDPSRVPLVPVIFNLDPPLSDMHFAGLTHQIELNPRRHYQFDLGFNLVDEPSGLRVECDYNSDLFDDATILRWLNDYALLLRTLPKEAATPLSNIKLLDKDSRGQVLTWGRGAQTPYPAHLTVHAIFEQRVAETPNAVALVDGEKKVTYAELDASANQYANYLRKQGLGEGAFVGLFGQRYWYFAAATLGILKIGGAFVPLDPRDPAARIASLRKHLDGVIEDKLDVSAESKEPGPTAGQPTGAAYVMFTSGSTGEPKGVVIPHQGITRLVCETDHATFDNKTVMMQGSNLCFDASTFELWGSLLHGGTLVFTRTDTLLDHDDLHQHIVQNCINTLFLTTSLFNQHARQAPELFKDLRCVVFGGEAADPSMINRVLEHGRPQQLVNGYGPTETTTFAVCHQIKNPAPSVPIGRPISNTDVFILDEQGQPVSPGITGEIYIGGPGVAIGYLHRPELTAERFIETEFGRLYRTGDYGRWLSNGTIDYQGRIDQQFKLRGFRIEPAEIEAQLRLHPAVAQCAVLPKTSPSGGEKVPVAYLVRRPEAQAVPDADFRQYLVQNLPPPFVPYQWFWLDSLPLTPNGKLDHRALPEPTVEAKPMRQHVPPQNSVHAHLIEIWEEVLNRKPIGIRDDFFDLGGHSLLAAKIIALIQERLGHRLSFGEFFSNPTIEKHALGLTGIQSPNRQTHSVAINADGKKTPVFFFHGDFVGGGFFCKTLASVIGNDRPFYALHPHGLQGDEVPLTIEAMAADRVKLIRELQPHGPYILGGYCNGSLTAYHAARLLRGAGEEVAVLLMLNSDGSNVRFRWLKRLTGVTSALRGEDEATRLQRFIQTRRRLRDREDMGRYYLNAAADLLKHPSKEKAAPFLRKAGRLFGIKPADPAAGPNGHSSPDVDAAVPRGPLSKPYADACRTFIPEHYDSRVVLLWPRDEKPLTKQGPSAGWEKVCDKVEVLPVPGHHHSCISQNQNVVLVGEAMKKAIQQAESLLK